MKIIIVVGARPNFMKAAPLIEEMKKHAEIDPILVHTGQHYDENMSKLFFRDLDLPKPDIHLGVGSGTHADQTARIMSTFEKVLLKQKYELVIVVGDVNSTIACALTAVKLNIKVAHVEAGLRSFDRTMPEEINRVLTDSISEYLFVTEPEAVKNLMAEGMPREKIFFVGNVMIDSLLKNKVKAEESNIANDLHLIDKDQIVPYALLTLHRPSSVDSRSTLIKLCEALACINKDIKIIYPAHPRAQKMIEESRLYSKFPFLRLQKPPTNNRRFLTIEPMGYVDFLYLMAHAKFVLTDSGGVQEETTALGIPCLTLRNNTERPVTITQGTNVIVGYDKNKIINESLKILDGHTKEYKIPELWDGRAAERIVDILLKRLVK